MKIGIVGYQGSGKSTLFEWLADTPADPALAHTTQSHMVCVPDKRIEHFCEIYHPKKVTLASINLVDTPGLSRTHEGSAGKLAMIREASCLVVVVAAFDSGDPLADLQSFEEDLLIADLDIVTGRIDRLREAIKKPRPNREQQQAELDLLERMQQELEAGRAIRDMELTVEQEKSIRAFQLFADKPRVVIVNVADVEEQPERFAKQAPANLDVTAVSLSLQLELSKMDEQERDDFCREMGVQVFGREGLLIKLMHASGQQLFFTVGEKDVRSWMIPQGATAVEAAGEIHTDLARGFIRAEVMRPEDLIRLGSEREVKAQHLMRQEPKDYVVQEGDIMFIRSGI